MAIYHLSTKPLSRSSGRSAVAAAAYRSGSCLSDQRQGIEHDYTRRSGVEHEQLVVPEGAGNWERQALWNAAEQAENRKDARTAREWEIALPEELNPLQRRELAGEFSQALCQRYGCAVDVAVHAPGKEGDQRNWHAHLLATTRQVTAAGLGEKCSIELSDKKRLSLGLGPARVEVDAVRQLWEQHANRALERAGRGERVSCQTLEKQKLEAERKGDHKKVLEFDRAPQVKLGWKASAMESRGVKTDRGDSLRAVKDENKQRQAELIDIATLRPQYERQKALEGTYQQAEALLRQHPTPDGRRGRVRQWEYAASRAIPTDARSYWEKHETQKEAVEWRQAHRDIAFYAKKLEQATKSVADWLKAHPVKSLLVNTGVSARPPELNLREEERDHAHRSLESARDRVAEIERQWRDGKSELRLHMDEVVLNHSAAIQQARSYLEAIIELRDRFEAFMAREDTVYEVRRRERERGRDRGKELGR
jgi:hypothetical protein